MEVSASAQPKRSREADRAEVGGTLAPIWEKSDVAWVSGRRHGIPMKTFMKPGRHARTERRALRDARVDPCDGQVLDQTSSRETLSTYSVEVAFSILTAEDIAENFTDFIGAAVKNRSAEVVVKQLNTEELKKVELFKYLGRQVSFVDCDVLAMRANLKKARGSPIPARTFGDSAKFWRSRASQRNS